MYGLEVGCCHFAVTYEGGGKHTHTSRDIATYRLHQPRGQLSENNVKNYTIRVCNSLPWLNAAICVLGPQTGETEA